ncbi:hypothetical protein AB0M79_26590 [Polymorphospora sp. NPDC051019]|uniref:hypothetical protein n=1 Tax=Polymorphospora sp. NPDC051019 TaxID=3155725 RepID=UPI00341E2151
MSSGRRAVAGAATGAFLVLATIRAFVLDPDATNWQIALWALQAGAMLVAYLVWWRPTDPGREYRGVDLNAKRLHW